MTANVAGRFLVATPVIAGPPFERAVVLVVEHDASGAVGVVVNLATDVPVTDVLPDFRVPLADPATVFVGGPVSTDTAVVVARSDRGPFTMVAPGVGVGIIDIDDPPEDATVARVFAGYSGWSAGQLEAELGEGSWWVLPASADDVFDADATTLWERVVARAPGSIAFHARFPRDPSLN